MNRKVTLTRAGYQKMKSELDYLMTTKRREIARDIAKARAFGDLKENAEYDAAKNAQAHNEKRIFDLNENLTSADILDDTRIAKDKIFLGAMVTLEDAQTKESIVYTLVSTEEADFKDNKISVTSPIGKALLGHKVNEEVSIKVPAGVLKYRILKIER